MGISPRKNLMDEFFSLDGWTENTFTSVTAQNLTHLSSSGGGIALFMVEVTPTAGASTSLATGDFVDLRFGFTTSDSKNHPFVQGLNTSTYNTNAFSAAGTQLLTTGVSDSSLLSMFGWARALTNIKMLFVPANVTVNARLSSVNIVSSVTLNSKLIPFPSNSPVSFWSVGSWISTMVFNLDASSLNLTQLDTGVLTPEILPGFWIFNSACRYNAEASTTKTQTATITRQGATVANSPFRLRTRTAAADSGANVVRTTQLYSLEHHPVNRVILDPIVSATHENYLSATHVPYSALTSLL